MANKFGFIKCENCGKFCRPYDSGTYFGTANDLEPPDESFFCEKCIKEILKEPEKVISGCWWLKPDYVSIAKSIIRHRRKHEFKSKRI